MELTGEQILVPNTHDIEWAPALARLMAASSAGWEESVMLLLESENLYFKELLSRHKRREKLAASS